MIEDFEIEILKDNYIIDKDELTNLYEKDVEETNRDKWFSKPSHFCYNDRNFVNILDVDDHVSLVYFQKKNRKVLTSDLVYDMEVQSWDGVFVLSFAAKQDVSFKQLDEKIKKIWFSQGVEDNDEEENNNNNNNNNNKKKKKKSNNKKKIGKPKKHVQSRFLLHKEEPKNSLEIPLFKTSTHIYSENYIYPENENILEDEEIYPIEKKFVDINIFDDMVVKYEVFVDGVQIDCYIKFGSNGLRNPKDHLAEKLSQEPIQILTRNGVPKIPCGLECHNVSYYITNHILTASTTSFFCFDCTTDKFGVNVRNKLSILENTPMCGIDALNPITIDESDDEEPMDEEPMDNDDNDDDNDVDNDDDDDEKSKKRKRGRPKGRKSTPKRYRRPKRKSTKKNK
eukprot:TRINITY_DN2743_c4_g1_i1.p1 TRINITY_DN2743_c4_g1~~TRINITY_DN2743_c4_g1_i1.p1  ORF type:complete len:396 (+),score=147.79 TRINITY_DN2743_c4_g1_i1:303-1490(+)